MSDGIYTFKVGDFNCIAVNDGIHTYSPPDFPPPATLLFVNAPGDQLKQALRSQNISLEEWTKWESPYICLVVDTGSHLVLVDTGAGALTPATGKLIPNLISEGITPGDIDIVVLTHGHPDHIGGNTDSRGNLAFPNARYVILREEWDFWTTDRAEKTLEEHSSEVLLKTARGNLPPLRAQIELVEHEAEIVTGIMAIAAPGHTPGHMALSISSGSEQLLCIADVLLHPIHLEHPEWLSVFDLLPEQVVATRRSLLNMAAAGGMLVLAFHFPFPGLGHVVPKDETWRWQPIKQQ
jgi:glyoxylase-like metal-dependent hydrolase (beta-lactamase superfamily II)